MCWFWPGNKDGSLFDVPISGRWPPLVLVQSPAHLHLYHGTFWNCHNMLCCSSPWLWTPTVLGLLCRSCCLIAQLCPTRWDPINRSTPGLAVHQQLPEFTQTHVHWVSDVIQLSHPLLSPSPAFNLSQHQGQWVSSLHQVVKILKFQLQHQSFQWIFRTDFLEDWLVESPCSPRDSQESSLAPQLESISSSALSLLYDPTLTFVHGYLKKL